MIRSASTRPLMLFSHQQRRLPSTLMKGSQPRRRQLMTNRTKRGTSQRRHESTYLRRLEEPVSSNRTSGSSLWEEALAYDVTLLKRIAAWYSAKLTSHPITTKAVTGGAIAAGGDLLCQGGTSTSTRNWYDFLTQEWDVMRTARFGLIGSTFVAPVCHYWYAYLHKYHAGASAAQISKRVALDQLVCTPPFMVVWLSSLWTLEGSVPPNQLPQAVTQAMPDVMKASWILWVPMQYLNFYAVPLKYQVLFTNVVELAWNAYLSFCATGGGGHGGHHHHGNQQQLLEEASKKEMETKEQIFR